MTTVDRYRSGHLQEHRPPDNARRMSSIATSYIPPAVPSPPIYHYNHNSHSRRPSSSPELSPTIKMPTEELSQWYFTDAELASTPSILSGLSVTEERSRRAKGVNFIYQAGILLKLPQVTLACASVFFNRFYMRLSMVPEKGGLHHYSIAATALFLAQKTEENCRKTKEVVIAVAKVAQKNANLIIDEQSKEYWRWRDNILLYEERMLEELTFDVVLQSPYNILWNYMQSLQLVEMKSLRNASWSFLNDSNLTVLCLMMPAKDIAVAALYFGAKHAGETIPDENGLPWWEHLGGDPEMIAKAVDIMSEFWTENPLKKENPFAHSPASTGNESDLYKTRAKGDPGSSREFNPDERSASQNGNVEENNTPAVNGNATTERPSTQQHYSVKAPTLAENKMEKSKSSDSLQPPTSGLVSPKPPQDLDTSGSSDAVQKAAANDPATHEATEASNLPDGPAPESKLTPKRKEREEDEEGEVSEPSAKRKKPDSTEAAPAVAADTENEEGEVEQ